MEDGIFLYFSKKIIDAIRKLAFGAGLNPDYDTCHHEGTVFATAPQILADQALEDEKKQSASPVNR